MMLDVYDVGDNAGPLVIGVLHPDNILGHIMLAMLILMTMVSIVWLVCCCFTPKQQYFSYVLAMI